MCLILVMMISLGGCSKYEEKPKVFMYNGYYRGTSIDELDEATIKRKTFEEKTTTKERSYAQGNKSVFDQTIYESDGYNDKKVAHILNTGEFPDEFKSQNVAVFKLNSDTVVVNPADGTIIEVTPLETLKKTDISDFYAEGSGLTISMLYTIDSKEYRMNFKNLSMLNDSIKKPVPDVTETDSHSLYFHDPAIMYAGRLINRGVALGKTGKTGKTASDALSQLTVELLKKNDTGEWVPANFSELY